MLLSNFSIHCVTIVTTYSSHENQKAICLTRKALVKQTLPHYNEGPVYMF